MKISFDLPPHFDIIDARFRVAGDRVIFAYGDTIFNPSRINITKELQAHEEVHGMRQLLFEGGPERWWYRYVCDPAFMLTEEIPAHQAEYRAYCKRHRGGGSQRERLEAIAGKLSGRLYGNIMSLEQAKRAILGDLA